MKINNKEFLNPQQQLYENTRDIEFLKANYQPVYNSSVELYDDEPAGSVALESTNAPVGTKSGWILDPNGYLFKITDGSTTALLIQYYAMIKGPQGETGETGAQGEQGIQGVQGEQGPQGPTGRNMLYCGTTVNRTEDYEGVVQKTYIDTYLPTGVTVNVGDLFINIEGILCQVKSIQTNYYGYKNLKRISGDKIFYTDLTLNSTIGNSTNIPWANIKDGTGTTRSYWNTFKDSLIIDSNGMLGQATDTYMGNSTIAGLKFKSIVSLKGPQGQTTIGIQVVAQLPASGTEGVIYLVPAEDPKTGNAYDEYIYTNNAWEKFGYVDIDLSNYALKSEIPVINEDLIPKTHNTYDLGASGLNYKTLWVGGIKNLYLDISTAGVGGTQGNPNGVATIKTKSGDGTVQSTLSINNLGYSFSNTIYPDTTETIDLGKSGSKFKNLYLSGKINPNSNTYGLALPDTTSFAADKTLATTDQIPTVNDRTITLIQNGVSQSFTLNQNSDKQITLLTVEANPTLAGTESDLTSIQIGATKYSIGSNMVTTDTSQTITGAKTFSAGYITVKSAASDSDYPNIRLTNYSGSQTNQIWKDGNKFDFSSTSNIQGYFLQTPDLSSLTSNKTIATVEDGAELQYTTTAPSAANTSGNLKGVVLTSEPGTYYNGYIYYITEA